MRKIDCNLKSCTFCSSCTPGWLELTALKKQSYLFKKGEHLFVEGQPVSGMYFMLSGAVKIHKKWGDDKDLIIRFAANGDILGVRGFGDINYKVTATALETTEVCLIPNRHLQDSLQANPTLTYKLMQLYAQELQRTEERMNNLVHMDVKGRVKLALVNLAETFGTDSAGLLNIPVSRQDIASYAGTTYETVFKIFTAWAEEGIIKTEGKRIWLNSIV